MCHGKDAYDAVATLHLTTEHAHGEVVIAPKRTVRNHHSLGEACGTAGVVDESQFLATGLALVVYVLLAEVFRVFLAEHLVEMLTRIGQLVGARHHKRVVGDVYYALKVGHLSLVDDRSHDVAYEQELGTTVVHDVVYLLRRELMEYRHGHRSIRQCGEKRHRPARAVASAKGYLVAFLHAAVLKHDVQFLYLACHIMVLQSSALEVCERVIVPVAYYALLDESVETVYTHVVNSLCRTRPLHRHASVKPRLPLHSGLAARHTSRHMTGGGSVRRCFFLDSVKCLMLYTTS